MRSRTRLVEDRTEKVREEGGVDGNLGTRRPKGGSRRYNRSSRIASLFFSSGFAGRMLRASGVLPQFLRKTDERLVKCDKMIAEFGDGFVNFAGSQETQETSARGDGRGEASSTRIDCLIEKAPYNRGQSCCHQHENGVSGRLGQKGVEFSYTLDPEFDVA